MKSLIDPQETKEMEVTMINWKNYTKKASHAIPFQLIGFKKDYEEEYEDFAEAVIDGFDMTCCQFAIEDPYKPPLVRALNDVTLALFSRFQFKYDMRLFTNIHIFCKRVRKYMEQQNQSNPLGCLPSYSLSSWLDESDAQGETLVVRPSGTLVV